MIPVFNTSRVTSHYVLDCSGRIIDELHRRCSSLDLDSTDGFQLKAIADTIKWFRKAYADHKDCCVFNSSGSHTPTLPRAGTADAAGSQHKLTAPVKPAGDRPSATTTARAAGWSRRHTATPKRGSGEVSIHLTPSPTAAGAHSNTADKPAGGVSVSIIAKQDEGPSNTNNTMKTLDLGTQISALSSSLLGGNLSSARSGNSAQPSTRRAPRRSMISMSRTEDVLALAGGVQFRLPSNAPSPKFAAHLGKGLERRDSLLPQAPAPRSQPHLHPASAGAAHIVHAVSAAKLTEPAITTAAQAPSTSPPPMGQAITAASPIAPLSSATVTPADPIKTSQVKLSPSREDTHSVSTDKLLSSNRRKNSLVLRSADDADAMLAAAYAAPGTVAAALRSAGVSLTGSVPPQQHSPASHSHSHSHSHGAAAHTTSLSVVTLETGLADSSSSEPQCMGVVPVFSGESGQFIHLPSVFDTSATPMIIKPALSPRTSVVLSSPPNAGSPRNSVVASKGSSMFRSSSHQSLGEQAQDGTPQPDASEEVKPPLEVLDEDAVLRDQSDHAHDNAVNAPTANEPAVEYSDVAAPVAETPAVDGADGDDEEAVVPSGNQDDQVDVGEVQAPEPIDQPAEQEHV